MIILRQGEYSKNQEKDDSLDNAAIASGAAITAGALSSRKVRGRLTGKVVRYHNTEAENVKSILEDGIKASKANDHNSYTRTILPHLKNDPSLDNLVYTSKNRLTANDIGATRAMHKEGRIFPELKDIKEILLPKKSKTLKIELDYDKDVKGSRRIENPELLGAKNWKEYHARRPGIFKNEEQSRGVFKSLGEGTHIFDHDIDPSKIVGGKGYKKRTIKDVERYIKNNPKRFMKGVAPVALGAGLLSAGAIHKISKKKKNKKK